MKKVSKKLKLLLIISILSVPVIVMAQPDPPPDPTGVDVPFDGGISLLLATGVAYGLKKVRDSKKAEKL